MTSRNAEEKIYLLEHQQSTLERQIREHKNNISDLKQQLLSTSPEQEKTILPSEQIQKSIDQVNDLETSKTVVAKKSVKPISDIPRKPKRNLRKIEQDFGKVWFVRLGIISLLTGLVFLSNFTYTNFILEWNAGPRLAGLYVLALALVGIGTYFEKAKVALSNYGKVLAAGGMATFYYTSYAAHHVDRLRVIDSVLLGCILLTASAGVCLAYALWKKSNVTAICSIALAYYSTSINPVGAFSLTSGLLLTLAGMVLLHKLRSAGIGFASMLGAYLSCIYWQLSMTDGGTGSPYSYAYTSWFIASYWILSATSFLIPRKIGAHPFRKTQLLIFASLNNAFLVLLMSLNFQTHQWIQPLWTVSAVIGLIFIGLAVFLKYGGSITSHIHKIPFRDSLVSLFLLKGAALITMALCLKLSGPSLALSLTIQSGLLLISACQSEGMRKLLLTIASYIVLTLGAFIYFSSTTKHPVDNTITHLVMAVLYLGISLIAHYRVSPQSETKSLQRGFPAVLSLLATSVCILSSGLPAFGAITILFSLNIACTLYQYLSAKNNIIPEFCHGSHLFTALGCITLLQNLHLYAAGHLFLFTLMLSSAAALNLCIFINRGTPHQQYRSYLIAATASLILSLIATESINIILFFGSLIPLAYHAFYQKLIQYRLHFIAVLGAIIYPLIWLAHIGSYLEPYSHNDHMLLHIIVTIIPIFHLVLLHQRKLQHLTFIISPLTLATAGMLTLWQITYIAPWELSVALTAGVYHLLDRRKTKQLTSIASVLYLSSILHAMSALAPKWTILYLIGLVPLGVYSYRKYILENTSSTPSQYYVSTQRGLAILTSLTLWIISSFHILHSYNGSGLSIVWAVTGLIILSLGFINRDIVFRTMAFIILGCTMLHVYGVDVWKLHAVLRILSFITLGLVLLITGYLYCRKVDQEEIED